MVRIVSTNYDSRVKLPEAVSIQRDVRAERFFQDLCTSNGADSSVLFQEMGILIDGKCYHKDSIITDGAKIYIMPMLVS